MQSYDCRTASPAAAPADMNSRRSASLCSSAMLACCSCSIPAASAASAASIPRRPLPSAVSANATAQNFYFIIYLFFALGKDHMLHSPARSLNRDPRHLFCTHSFSPQALTLQSGFASSHIPSKTPLRTLLQGHEEGVKCL